MITGVVLTFIVRDGLEAYTCDDNITTTTASTSLHFASFGLMETVWHNLLLFRRTLLLQAVNLNALSSPHRCLTLFHTLSLLIEDFRQGVCVYAEEKAFFYFTFTFFFSNLGCLESVLLLYHYYPFAGVVCIDATALSSTKCNNVPCRTTMSLLRRISIDFYCQTT